MQERQLIANIWRTPAGNILQSKHQHDFVSDAEGFFIDGGLGGYTRFGGGRFDEWEDLSVYTDSPHELIREHFVWKHGEIPEGVYTVLKMLTEDHIEVIIETQKHLPEHVMQMFEDELSFRDELKKFNERLNYV